MFATIAPVLSATATTPKSLVDRESIRRRYYKRQSATARRLADYWSDIAGKLDEHTAEWKTAVACCGDHERRYVRMANLALVLATVKGKQAGASK